MSDKGNGDGNYNRLKDCASPYLRQHADNPVDWYPWGEEAFRKAKREDKPIFLSIGYSTCHWCHVMEHESFEDTAVARLMNETFVSIKVDREERPDIDKVYMNVCQMLTGSGGWPLTIIMTPEREPFFAGTYFPKTARFGRMGMMELVPRIRELWDTRREDLEKDAGKVVSALKESSAAQPDTAELGRDVLRHAFDGLAGRYDSSFGGFGEAPKFPTPHNIYFLLRWWKRSGDDKALEMAAGTLRHMRLGGIYDHVGFGFHRYSTDRRWHTPHFEKMLYDQALIAIACLETYQATGEDLFARTASEIFTYVMRDLRSPDGAYYSAEDADVEGEEGKFYLWTRAELDSLLGEDQLELAMRVWGVTEDGNYFEEASGQQSGDNVLHMQGAHGELARELGIDESELRGRLEEIRKVLFEAREDRVRPGLDDKVLADWNGLIAAALARAAVVLEDDEYAEAAAAAMDFVLERMSADGGRLLHRWGDTGAGVTGMLDDYAFTIWALLELYEAGFDPRRLEQARRLTDVMIEEFWDEDGGGFWFTAEDSEQLLARQKDLYDGATPSGNSVAAMDLLRLARITADENLEHRVNELAQTFGGNVRHAPIAYTHFLCALDFALGPSREIVVAAPSGDGGGAVEMARGLQRPFVPNKIVLVDRGGELAGLAPFTGRMSPQEGKPTAYVCVDYACELPTTDPDQALKLLTGENDDGI